MTGRPAWVVPAFAAAGAGFVCFVAGLAATDGGAAAALVDEWLYNGLFLVAFALTVARAALVAEDRVAWGVIALGLGCTAFAEIYYLAAAPETYPSVADAAWLAFYPLAYVGIVLLVRRRSRSVTGTLWLDGLTGAVTAAAVASAVLVEVVLRSLEGSVSAVATNLAYPLGDVLLLSAVVGVFSLAGWNLERRWLVLALGILATAVADGIYLFQVETYEPGGLLDSLWPLSTLLIALAAWLDTSGERGLRLDGRPLLAVPAACLLFGTAILVVDHFAGVNMLAVLLAAASLVLVLVRLVFTFRENERLYALTRQEAVTDALTGLGNRRRLVLDLERAFGDAGARPALLMLFDLDGFKAYNDSFGHPAGDALLARLAEKLATVPGDGGGAYRLGGDEFCVVTPVADGEAETAIHRACEALTERGEGFEVSSSFGAVLLPDEATDASHALSLADERLYAQKRARRVSADHSMQALLGALTRREPEAETYVDDVEELSLRVGRRLGLAGSELAELTRAARFHDLGKLAVPDEILGKPGPLDEQEWEFIRRHPVVGERILRASPGFRPAATIVRSTHESWDGSGYPDGLAGGTIPLASRIIHACDALVAMTSLRPHRPARALEDALAELDRCAGTQFDPTVVRALAADVREALAAKRVA